MNHFIVMLRVHVLQTMLRSLQTTHLQTLCWTYYGICYNFMFKNT